MKRTLSLILILLFCFQLTACRKNPADYSSETNSAFSVTESDTQSEIYDFEQVEEIKKTESTSSKSNTSSAVSKKKESSGSSSQSGSSDYGSSTTTQIETPKEVAKLPTITATVTTYTKHTALKESDYYQFSCLNSSEKSLYKVIVTAIRNGKTVVDLGGYNCTVETLNKVYQAVVDDYPQFFYVSKSFSYTINSKNGAVTDLISLYCDGETEDKYNQKGELIAMADRGLISAQITEFNLITKDIADGISASVSQTEKEKYIYDYLQDTVTYDNQAADSVSNGENVVSHSFSAYGAACGKTAVCEGYAKLFQYLCYCMGINATQIFGTASGGSHMWNAVCIDSKWYLTDVTWDDSDVKGLHCYSYFNLTSQKMNQNHTADNSVLSVPPCVSTDAAFHNFGALYIKNLSQTPENYKTVIDYAVANKENYLCIYTGEASGDFETFITTYLFSQKCDIQRYVAQMGYKISFDTRYYTKDDYYYIPIIQVA